MLGRTDIAMITLRKIGAAVCCLGLISLCLAVESGMYRLLSISASEKLILVSQIPGKTKYLLDASSTKITVDGKPAEFSELKAFSVVQVKLELRKATRNGIPIDGSATEISISGSDNPK